MPRITFKDETFKIVNRVELADELAELIMYEKYTEDELYAGIADEPDTLHLATEELQDEYIELYYHYGTIIDRCTGGMDGLFNVDWELLESHKPTLVYIRSHFPKDSKQRKALTGVIHLIDNLQDTFTTEE